MPHFLPLFPLSLVVYPGEEVRLHIFEARYRQLIEECLEEGTTFGIPVVIDQQAKQIATELEVLSMDRKHQGGEMDVSTRGLHRIDIQEFFRVSPGKLYPGGMVEQISDDYTTDPGLQEVVFGLLSQLHQALGITKQLAKEPSEVQSFLLAHHIGFTLEQEFELLSIGSESDRLLYMRHHLEQTIPVVLQTERLKAKAKLNGHYKNIVPPEI
jgi:hypothetical protein